MRATKTTAITDRVKAKSWNHRVESSYYSLCRRTMKSTCSPQGLRVTKNWGKVPVSSRKMTGCWRMQKKHTDRQQHILKFSIPCISVSKDVTVGQNLPTQVRTWESWYGMFINFSTWCTSTKQNCAIPVNSIGIPIGGRSHNPYETGICITNNRRLLFS